MRAVTIKVYRPGASGVGRVALWTVCTTLCAPLPCSLTKALLTAGTYLGALELTGD